MLYQWPTLARQRHLDALAAALNSTGSGVLITGGAGVGKTALARHAMYTLDGVPRWAAGTETARAIPLGAFAHLVDVVDPGEPHTILRAARAHLLVNGARVVIGVDDAHLLDQLSATVVHQLALDRAARFVVTVRTGATVPDAVLALWKDDLLGRVDLTPFSRDEVLELVERVLGGPVEPVSADRLFEISQGNPLFLRHLVEGGLTAGNFREVAGVWQMRGETVISAQLSALVEVRLAGLAPGALRVVELLGFGGTLDLETLVGLVDRAGVEDAELSGLTRVNSTGLIGRAAVPSRERRLTVELTHPIYGEVIRSRTRLLKARRIRGELAQALAAGAPTHVSDRIRVVALAQDSDRPPGPAALLESAAAALTLGDVGLAERLSRRAGELGGGAAAAALLGSALSWQGEGEQAERVLAAVDRSALAEADLIAWTMSRAFNKFWMLGDPDGAAAVLADAEESVTVPGARLVIDLLIGLFEDRPEVALPASRALLDAAEVTPMARGWAAFAAATAHAQAGRFAEVAPLVEIGLAAAAGGAAGLLRFNLGLVEIATLVAQGRLGDAAQAARRYVRFAVHLQPGRGKADVLVGQVGLATGDLPATRELLVQATAALRGVGHVWEFLGTAVLCQVQAALGDVAGAQRSLARAEPLCRAPIVALLVPLELSRAWTAAAEGHSSAAIAHAHRGAELAAERERWLYEADALFTAVRFGDRTVADRLAELADRIDAGTVSGYAEHAAALVADDGDRLSAMAQRWESAGALSFAADAAAQAAMAYAAAGDQRTELTAAAGAHRLAEACGGARTPALLAAAHPLPLTAREREIASLVALGRSNKEIAEQLTVSVRTVEGHIYRSCIKLDVADRDALAQIVSRAAAPPVRVSPPSEGEKRARH